MGNATETSSVSKKTGAVALAQTIGSTGGRSLGHRFETFSIC